MPAFNPTAGSSSPVPDFTGSSKGIRSEDKRTDTSAGDLFEGLGKGLLLGVEAIDQGIQAEIQEDVNEGFAEIEAEFGVDAMASEEEFGDVFGNQPVPAELQNGASHLDRLQAAIASGQISERHYYARAQSLVRQLRGRYPGYQQEIDTMIQNVTGVRPANALRREAMSDWGADTDDQERRRLNFIEKHIDVVEAAVGPDYMNQPLPDLYRGVSKYLARDTEIKRNEAEASYQQTQKNLSLEKVNQNLRTDLKHTVNHILSLGLEQADKQMGESVRQQLDHLLQRKAKGEQLRSEDVQRLAAYLQLVESQINEAINMTLGKQWEGADDPNLNYNRVLSGQEIEEAREEALKPLETIKKLVISGEFSLLKMPLAQLEGWRNDVTNSLLERYDLSMPVAISNAAGADAAAAWAALFPSQQFKELEIINQMHAGEIQLGKLGEMSAKKHYDQVQQAPDINDEQATSILNGDIQRWQNMVNAVGTDKAIPMEMFVKEAHYWFSEDNYNLTTDLLKSDEDKAEYFRRIASPKTTQVMLQLKKSGETELWDKYQSWVANEFKVQFKGPISVIQDRVLTPEIFDVQWDSTRNRFSIVENPDMSPTLRNSLQYSGEVRDIRKAEREINAAIQLVAPIIQENDRHVSEELLQLFAQMGYDPNVQPEEPTLVDNLMDALMRELKILGEDIRSFDDLGLTTNPEGRPPGFSGFHRLRDNIWDKLSPFSAPFRAPEERRGDQGGQTRSVTQKTSAVSEPPNPDLDKRLNELKEEYPDAVAALQQSPTPPKFDDLGWMVRYKLSEEAKALGVTPQQVIDRAHDMVNHKPKAKMHLITNYLQHGKHESHVEGLRDDFAGRLSNALEDPAMPKGVTIYSGYRSPEHQERLWKQALKKYVSPAAARKWVAPPGGSQHNHGNAADLLYNGVRLDKIDPAIRQRIHDVMGRYGMHFRMSHEPWHVEVNPAAKPLDQMSMEEKFEFLEKMYG